MGCMSYSLHLLSNLIDGYSVKDISYVWKDGPVNSVGIRPDVQLPQFKVRGHRLRTKLERLTTGFTFYTCYQQTI